MSLPKNYIYIYMLYHFLNKLFNQLLPLASSFISEGSIADVIALSEVAP